MTKSKFIILILLLGVLILAGAGCWEEKEKIELKMDKTTFDQGEVIKVRVESEKKLFTGFPAFEVYQLVDDGWQWIDVYDMACALPCSADEKDICTETPIACAPSPEHCQDFNPLVDKFDWDQTVLETRENDCSNLDETRICSFHEMAEPGKYKVVFQYSEKCVGEDLFLAEENNVQKIEKEFGIKPQYIKVENFYGEWPIYYDQFVEFEGYVTFAYECVSSGECLDPYFLVYKELLPYRHYSTGQVIIQHKYGEEVEEGKKYRIRGRLLPPEQAFLIETVYPIPNVEPRVVIQPSEPAVETKD